MRRPGTGLRAALDRRVVLEDRTHYRLSELRDRTCLVVLGGPGAGKTDALAREAAIDGVKEISTRAAVRSPTAFGAACVYLDMLDEFRSTGHGGDRLDELLTRLHASRPDRLRIGCRSDDWRGPVDRDELATIYPGVTVATLLPLEHHEARAILAALGHAAPDALLADAERAGLAGLLATPLTVSLLHTVAAKGTGSLPTGRGSLYRDACDVLVREHEPARRAVRASARPPARALLDAAGRTCLSFLLREADALVRYSDPMTAVLEPVPGQLPIEDVPAETTTVGWALSTGLFQGDGERFEPIHRSIAEYLGARTLVERCTATSGAVHLDRLLGLTSGVDGRAPSGLRGLFAWFAALLGEAGETDLASRLARIDPVTVLLHGDVGLLGDDAKRVLLHALENADDPFFRMEDAPEALLGGLASPALVPDFDRLLRRSTQSHVRITLFDALTYGPPMPGLESALRALALDSREPRWMRRRSVDALLDCAERPAAERRLLRCALRTESESDGRFATQMALLLRSPDGHMQDGEILRVLADHERCPAEGHPLRLSGLAQRLRNRPNRALLDAMRPGWRDPPVGGRHASDVDELLCTVIERTLDAVDGPASDPTPARLARWLARAGLVRHGMLSGRLCDAVDRWASRAPGTDRRAALLFEMTCGDEPAWGAGSNYTTLFGEAPVPAVLDGLLDALPGITDPEVRQRCVDVLANVARELAPSDAWRRKCIDVLTAEGEADDAHYLEFRSLPLHDAHVAAWKRFEREEKTRSGVRRRAMRRKALSAHVDVLADAKPQAIGVLGELLDEIDHRSWDEDDVTEPLAALVGEPVARAVVRGWRNVARRGVLPLSAAEIGKGGANGTRYAAVELGAAGAELLVRDGEWSSPDQLTPELAAAVLVDAEVPSGRAGERVVAMAVDRACGSADGREALCALWGPYRDARVDHALPGLDAFAERATASDELGAWLIDRLDEFARSPGRRIAGLLRLAVRVLGREAMTDKVWATLATLPKAFVSRSDWLATAFALDPARTLPELEGLAGVDGIDRVVEPYLRSGARDGRPAVIDTEDQAARRHRLLAPLLVPRVPYDVPAFGIQRVDAGYQVRQMALQCVQALATGSDPADLTALTDLLGDPANGDWAARLRNARAGWVAAYRNGLFEASDSETIAAVLDDGPPRTASDVAAIGRIELAELEHRIRTDDVLSWREFWIRPAAGPVEKPLGENDCRDILIQKMRNRLERYGVPGTLPEVQRQGATRVDILLHTADAASYPIEVKRADNAQLWTAPEGQLAGYARHPDAGGLGAYLVLWFGRGHELVQGHPEHGQPEDIEQLRVWLRAITPNELDLFVFDLAPPGAPAPPSAKRSGAPGKKRPARSSTGGGKGAVKRRAR